MIFQITEDLAHSNLHRVCRLKALENDHPTLDKDVVYPLPDSGIFRVVERHAAGRNQLHVRERPLHVLEEGRTERGGGKHLDQIRARLPGGQDLCWRETPR